MYIELFDEMRGCGLSTVLLFIMVAALGALMVWNSRTARKKKALLAVLAALTVLCELGLHLMRGNMQVLLVPLGWGCMFLLLGGLVMCAVQAVRHKRG